MTREEEKLENSLRLRQTLCLWKETCVAWASDLMQLYCPNL